MLLNGVPHTTLPMDDRGLHYGDGHFTTMLVRNGVVDNWPAHLARLQQANSALQLGEVPWYQLADEVATLAKCQSRAVIKVIITRGSGGRGYDGTTAVQPHRLLLVSDYPAHYDTWQKTGIEIVVCQQRIGVSPLLAGLKTLNRLEQVLLKNELVARNAVEGIVLNYQEELVEAVSANLFWRIDNCVFTPDLALSGVNGMMRQRVIERLNHWGIPLKIVKAPLERLWQAHEMWLTNSLMGVVAVNALEERRYTSWPLTMRLQESLHREI